MEISEKHFVTGNNIRPPHPDGFLELRVGMGCFWGPEKIFWELELLLPGHLIQKGGLSLKLQISNFFRILT